MASSNSLQEDKLIPNAEAIENLGEVENKIHKIDLTSKESTDSSDKVEETSKHDESIQTSERVKETQDVAAISLQKRFQASMVLAGVGDALGYKNGSYEFCRRGDFINKDVEDNFGGVSKIKVDPRNWIVSDDTVMHIATAEALVSEWVDSEQLYSTLAKKYIECMRDMSGRAPGNTCMASVHKLRPLRPRGYYIPFNTHGGGCGAAMRAAPIGLLYNHPDQLKQLVAVSIESGRMTHNHPTGYLGSLATSLFVSYAIQQKPLIEWGKGLLECLDLAWQYIKDEGRDVPENEKHWGYFKDHWEKYLQTRGIQDGQSPPQFPQDYGPSERDKFYKSVSYSGWGGSSGHDAPMIAYDALLSCGGSWEELCKRGMFHGGDSDSTGIIAAACWGAMNGYKEVPLGHYENLEYRDRLETLSKKLYEKFITESSTASKEEKKPKE